MDGETKGSRFAELALELFGAQAAQKFLSEVWEQASPEVKRKLADEVLTLVAKNLGGDFGVRDSLVRNVVASCLAEHEDKIRALARDAMDKRLDADVQAAVTAQVSWIHRSVEGVTEEQLRRAVQEALARRDALALRRA